MVFIQTRTKLVKYSKNKKILTKTAVLLSLVLFMLSPYPIYAISDEEQLQDLNEEILAAKERLSVIRNQKSSLENELAAFDLEISTVQKQINATQAEINVINRQISDTRQKIAEAEKNLNYQNSMMKEYIRTMYIEGQITTLELIAESDNFSDFVDRSEYLNTMHERVQETAEKIVALKSQLEDQKKQQEVKKSKAEQLKSQQLAQKAVLNSKRSGRQYILDQTAGSEANYKSYLADLQQKFTRLQESIWAKASGGYVSLGHVNRGDVIGYIGNTGYSTGCHLHFEIRTSPSTHVNPASYLGNGYFINPVSGVPMNVPYGISSYYFPGVFHTGQDYADGCAGTAIRATADGDIITRITGQGNTYPGGPVSYGNYVMIRHTNGMYSLYGHMR